MGRGWDGPTLTHLEGAPWQGWSRGRKRCVVRILFTAKPHAHLHEAHTRVLSVLAMRPGWIGGFCATYGCCATGAAEPA